MVYKMKKLKKKESYGTKSPLFFSLSLSILWRRFSPINQGLVRVYTTTGL